MTEYSLHSEIKNWYMVSGDELEVKVEGFIIDIVRGKLLIEIQTGNFSVVKKKLIKLLKQSGSVGLSHCQTKMDSSYI